jgi:hypothetical protein
LIDNFDFGIKYENKFNSYLIGCLLGDGGLTNSVTLTTGFTNLFVDKAAGSDLGFIPAKAGFKAFVWNDQFYVMGEAGAAFAVTNGYHKTSLLLAPSIGYATKYIDISLRYEHYNDFARVNNNGTRSDGVGQVAVRLAYGLAL